MSSINGVVKKYLFSSSQFACYLLHFEQYDTIQQLKHWNQIGVLIVSVKIIFQGAFIPSLLWKFSLIRSLTEPWKFVINCNEFVAYFFLYKRHPVFTCSSSSYCTCGWRITLSELKLFNCLHTMAPAWVPITGYYVNVVFNLIVEN